MEVAVIARHGEPAYNVAGRVNGNPSIDVPLTKRGIEQARALGGQLEAFPLETCVHTSFRRTRSTARVALDRMGIDVPLVREPRFDEIGCGSMEGWSVARDHGWRAARPRDWRPAGGESIAAAALRVAAALEWLAARPERAVAVVTHELALRYALNSRAGSADIAGPWREVPQATPFVFDGDELLDAACTIRRAASGPWGRAVPGRAANGG